MCFLQVVTNISDVNAQSRTESIKKYINEMANADPISAAVIADEALAEDDPLLKSIILEKVLMHEDSRVRGIGFRYIVSEIQRVVVVATAPESLMQNEKIYKGDRDQLARSLTLEVKFSDFNPKTSRFKCYINPWGGCEGAVGLDGITIIDGERKININRVIKSNLVGTTTYRLSNYGIPIALPSQTALP